MEAFRLRHHILIPLIPCIVEHDGDRSIRELASELVQEFDDTDAVNVSVVRYGNNLMGGGMEGT